MSEVSAAAIASLFRQEYARAVSVLVRVCGNIDDAEEAVQEAFAEAMQRWPVAGLPPSPVGWIITTARNRAIDRHRRESSRTERETRAAMQESDEKLDEGDVMRDDPLRLMFTCCHPALGQSAQVALALRLIGGLTTPEIANAFFVSEATMAQRLVRAKGKIRDAGIPYRIPQQSELATRLRSVLAVVYLIFNEGYKASSGKQLVREDLCSDAIRMGRLLAELMPDEPEVLGLLALMSFTEARRRARVTSSGEIVLLAEQDRTLWDRSLIAEGHTLVNQCLSRDPLGPYQLQAAINAVHASAARFEDTDWRRIVALYDMLLAIAPTPVVRLNRAVAIAEVHGPEVALPLVEELAHESYLYHAVRADLLRRAGRLTEALEAYEAAIERADNAAEQRLLERKRQSIREASPK